jgi:hypothetical protein
MKTNRVFMGLIVAMLVAMSGQMAMAQSTIFNIPTTDAVAKGSVYFEFDYFGQMPKFADLPDGTTQHRLHVYAPRVVVGLGGNVEAGVNVATFHQGDTNNAFFQPNLKWKFFSNDKGVASSVGAILYTPINNRDGVDTFPLVYANLSKKVDHAYGPRFHIGPYSLIGTDTAFGVTGARAGVIAGYEQPIHAKASIVADWLSGKNGFGYFTPGVSFTLPGSGLLNIGYSIGNDSWENDNATHNRLLFVYYGVTF